jgi:hypothetical protein
MTSTDVNMVGLNYNAENLDHNLYIDHSFSYDLFDDSHTAM